VKRVDIRLTLLGIGLIFLICCQDSGAAAPISPDSIPATTNAMFPVDLPAVLRLAGAQNLDVQIARERLNEARANRNSAVEQFLPWAAPGIAYHRRDGMAQAVPAGIVSDSHFESYAPGGAFSAQLTLGDAIYESLAAKKLVEASAQALESERLDSALTAVQNFFDLVKAAAVADILKDAVRISRAYENQLHEAVGEGIVFKGDELRVRTQTQSYEIALRRALEQQRAAGASLAQTLHLDATLNLQPLDPGLLPLVLFPTNAVLDTLVQKALQRRSELKQSRALAAAARDSKNGALYGPLIPIFGAQVFTGGFGGGPDNGPGNFGDSQDYQFALSWRIGPGGLFDFGRQNARKARLKVVELGEAKLKDAIIAQVVTRHTAIQSLSEQIALAERKLATTHEMLQLTRDRKQFGVGIVLEDIQAQQEFIKARADYVSTVAEFNKAEYALNRVVGNSVP
jgi:outer membrane protein TolC